jgi:hypothetical protein
MLAYFTRRLLNQLFEGHLNFLSRKGDPHDCTQEQRSDYRSWPCIEANARNLHRVLHGSGLGTIYLVSGTVASRRDRMLLEKLCGNKSAGDGVSEGKTSSDSPTPAAQWSRSG